MLSGGFQFIKSVLSTTITVLEFTELAVLLSDLPLCSSFDHDYAFIISFISNITLVFWLFNKYEPVLIYYCIA